MCIFYLSYLKMDKKYRLVLNRVVDGDTIDADIVLGFGVVLQNKRIRLAGVDTPEVRTSDDVEKGFGLRAKAFVANWCAGDGELILVIKGDEYDKFGRVLGDVHDDKGNSLVEDIINNYHGVAYYGKSKDDIKKAHLENRIKLNTI